MTAEDISRWNCIYPAYINSSRSVVQGRRVPKEKGAVEPRIQEIKDVLEATGSFKVVAEPKPCFPRELDKEPGRACIGRVRYQLVKEDPRFSKKQDILVFVGESISKMKNRKTTQDKPTVEAAQTTTTTGGKGKKGKKK